MRRSNLRLMSVSKEGTCGHYWIRSTPTWCFLPIWRRTVHLKVAVGAAFGPDSAEGGARFETRRHVLRHDPGGGQARRSAHSLPAGQGNGQRRHCPGTPAFIQNNRKRMNYGKVVDAGRPIGSGAGEAANCLPVNSRMKRSGKLLGTRRRPGRGRADVPVTAQVGSLRPGMG